MSRVVWQSFALWSQNHHHLGLLIAAAPTVLAIALYSASRKLKTQGGASSNPRSKKGKQRVTTSEVSAELAANKRHGAMEEEEEEEEEEAEISLTKSNRLV